MRAFLVAAALLAASSAAGAEPAVVRTPDELPDALRRPGNGGAILAEGRYETRQPILLEGLRGTVDRPLVIRAARRGRAVIAGVAGFTLRDCEHVVIEGFVFENDANRQAVLLDNCRQVRVTRNVFRPDESSPQRHMQHWVYLVGANSGSNRIDRNFFGRKINSGSPVFTRGDDASLRCSQHDRIDHNLFRDVVYAGGTNGHETIRTGGNDLGAAGRSSFALIESNLLIACSGEDEVLSIKSSDNVIRGNTLVDCRGAICLRLGNRNEVSGNVVLNPGGGKGSGGVKLYGHDHRVSGNYFDGLTGRRHEAPLALVPGTIDAEATDRIGKRYRDDTAAAPRRAWIAHNTWVDCSALQFGFAPEAYRPFVPAACVFVSNAVVRTKAIAAPPVNLEPVRDVRAYDNRAIGFAPGTNVWAAWFAPGDRVPAAPPRLTESDVGPDAP